MEVNGYVAIGVAAWVVVGPVVTGLVSAKWNRKNEIENRNLTIVFQNFFFYHHHKSYQKQLKSY